MEARRIRGPFLYQLNDRSQQFAFYYVNGEGWRPTGRDCGTQIIARDRYKPALAYLEENWSDGPYQ